VVPQAYPQRIYPVRRLGGGTNTQISDLVDLRWLLRARRGCEQHEGEEHTGSNP